MMKDNYNPANYISQKDASDILKVSLNTLSRYLKQGKIRKYTINSRKVLCNRDDVYRLLNLPVNSDGKNVVYARVSRNNETDILREQVATVTKFAVKNGIKIDKVYADVCPSYSFKQQRRPEFYSLLKEINKSLIKNIYIQSPDRITRFGTEFFEEICNYYKVNVIYLTPNIADTHSKNEVRDEVLYVLKQLKEMYEL